MLSHLTGSKGWVQQNSTGLMFTCCQLFAHICHCALRCVCTLIIHSCTSWAASLCIYHHVVVHFYSQQNSRLLPQLVWADYYYQCFESETKKKVKSEGKTLLLRFNYVWNSINHTWMITGWDKMWIWAFWILLLQNLHIWPQGRFSPVVVLILM